MRLKKEETYMLTIKADDLVKILQKQNILPKDFTFEGKIVETGLYKGTIDKYEYLTFTWTHEALLRSGGIQKKEPVRRDRPAKRPITRKPVLVDREPDGCQAHYPCVPIPERLQKTKLRGTLKDYSEVDKDHGVLWERVGNLGVSGRVATCFLNAGIYSIGELIQYTPGELLQIRRFGRGSLKHVLGRLRKRNLSLSPDVVQNKHCYR